MKTNKTTLQNKKITVTIESITKSDLLKKIKKQRLKTAVFVSKFLTFSNYAFSRARVLVVISATSEGPKY